MKKPVMLSSANRAFREGRYLDAKRFYEGLADAPEPLGGQVRFNLELVRRRLALQGHRRKPVKDDLEGIRLGKLFSRRLDQFKEAQISFNQMELRSPASRNQFFSVRENEQTKVLVGTLSSGENEELQCLRSVQWQDYPSCLITHKVFRNLPKKKAINTLFRFFLESDADLLIKLDADMIMLDSCFISRVVRYFKFRPQTGILQCALSDYFSGSIMQGINIYSKLMSWQPESQDALFTDKTSTSKEKRYVEWISFRDSVIHSPNPSDFQAFHFGAHRGLKARQAVRNKEFSRAEEQLFYLEQTWKHFLIRKDKALLLAVLGGEMAITGLIELPELNYTNPRLKKRFDSIRDKPTDLLIEDVNSFRHERYNNPRSEARDIVLSPDSSFYRKIKDVLFLVPHARVFGGINRFFEMTRHLRLDGLRPAICVGSERLTAAEFIRLRTDFPDVAVMNVEAATRKVWDLVVCGDYSSGIMLCMPLIKSRTYGVFLLNGYQHRIHNLKQIETLRPDFIWANSSYCAEQYPELSAEVVAGGVDLQVFYPLHPKLENQESPGIRVLIPGGRLKSRKRVKDALKAIQSAIRCGLKLDVHVFNSTPLSVEFDIPVTVHAVLSREGVANLMRSTHVVICPEEDAGWNNPAAEAMACGIPLVCTSAGTTDFALDGKTAWVVKARDVEGIENALKDIVANPSDARKRVIAGLSIIEQYSWERYCRNFRDSIDKVRVRTDADIDRWTAKTNELIDGALSSRFSET